MTSERIALLVIALTVAAMVGLSGVANHLIAVQALKRAAIAAGVL